MRTTVSSVILLSYQKFFNFQPPPFIFWRQTYPDNCGDKNQYRNNLYPTELKLYPKQGESRDSSAREVTSSLARPPLAKLQSPRYTFLMAAKNSVKEFVPDSYYHLYNRGVEKRTIFLDEQDRTVFLSYLKNLPPPKR